MNKTNKILVALVVILLIAFGVVLYWQRGGFDKAYSAVYLSTGDLYFGKASHFPKLSISDVWLLQRSDDQQNPFGITRFDKAFWGPEDVLYLDSKNVVWITNLKKDSELVKFFKNPQSAQQQNSAVQQQQQGEQQNLNPEQ